MGRKPEVIPKVKWHLMVPEPIATEIDLLLVDPFTGKVQYGARSNLVTRLLAAWIKKHQKEKKDGTNDA